jgi:hypothetical protein
MIKIPFYRASNPLPVVRIARSDLRGYMFNVQVAQTLISHITFLIAYLISITFAGCFTAWVAQKMGDDTAADSGFLSLNPIVHIDFFGLIFLLMYHFGWGKFIPRNPQNITGKFRYLKIFIMFIARSVGYALIGMIALIFLIVLFGGQILTTPYSPLQAFPETSSYTFAVSFILMSMLYVDMMLTAVSFLVDMCGMILALFLEEYPEYAVYASLVMMLVPVILFYLFGSALVVFIFGLIQGCGHFVAQLLHLC